MVNTDALAQGLSLRVRATQVMVLADQLCANCGAKARSAFGGLACSVECAAELVPPAPRSVHKGEKRLCPGCRRVKTANGRGLCRLCYEDKLVRYATPPARGWRAWTAEEDAAVMELQPAQAVHQLNRTRRQCVQRRYYLRRLKYR